MWTTLRDTGAVARVTRAAQVTTFPVPLPPGSEPRRIVAGPDGALWVTLFRASAVGPADDGRRVVDLPGRPDAGRRAARARPGGRAGCGSPSRAGTASSGSTPPARRPGRSRPRTPAGPRTSPGHRRRHVVHRGRRRPDRQGHPGRQGHRVLRRHHAGRQPVQHRRRARTTPCGSRRRTGTASAARRRTATSPSTTCPAGVVPRRIILGPGGKLWLAFAGTGQVVRFTPPLAPVTPADLGYAYTRLSGGKADFTRLEVEGLPPGGASARAAAGRLPGPQLHQEGQARVDLRREVRPSAPGRQPRDPHGGDRLRDEGAHLQGVAERLEASRPAASRRGPRRCARAAAEYVPAGVRCARRARRGRHHPDLRAAPPRARLRADPRARQRVDRRHHDGAPAAGRPRPAQLDVRPGRLPPGRVRHRPGARRRAGPRRTGSCRSTPTSSGSPRRAGRRRWTAAAGPERSRPSASSSSSAASSAGRIRGGLLTMTMRVPGTGARRGRDRRRSSPASARCSRSAPPRSSRCARARRLDRRPRRARRDVGWPGRSRPPTP